MSAPRPSRRSTTTVQARISASRTILVSGDPPARIPAHRRTSRQQHQVGRSLPSTGIRISPIDLEAIDDDLQMLSSLSPPASNRTRRNRPITVDLEVDVEVDSVRSGVPTEEPVVLISVNNRNIRERIPSNRTNKNVVKLPPEPKMVPPKEPIFTCPVCLNPLAEASSTICGHVFCEGCIKTSIQAHKKCPICARKLTMNNFHRVYLPSAE